MRHARFLTVLALAAAAVPATLPAQKREGKAGITLASVADSAALVQALAALPGRPVSGGSRYSVHIGSAGLPDEISILSSPVTPFDSAVVALLRARLTRPVPTPQGAFVYLVGAWGAHPMLSTYLPTQNRAPELINQRVIEAGLEAIGRQFGARLTGGGVHVTARMRVDAGGVPGAVALDHRTGVAELDGAIVSLMRRSRFRPALLDGGPAAVWVTFPVNLVVPQP